MECLSTHKDTNARNDAAYMRSNHNPSRYVDKLIRKPARGLGIDVIVNKEPTS